MAAQPALVGGRLNYPAIGGEAVTPSDSLDLNQPSRGLMASVAGNVKITMIDGSVLTIPVLANVIYPLGITRVWSTTTTATGMFAFY